MYVENKRSGLYGGVVHIDEDARVEYWTRIRERPDLAGELTEYRAGASTRTAGTTRRNDAHFTGENHVVCRSLG
ncbi:hypothetical protein ACSRUE_21385 [Sorangium sp. KYC3313]|uniref:hypothetical protein n=1 Tax=Sorangium sp. KYC3313 TaxID=3449740 RepID=UPI003F8CDBF2